MTTDRPSYTPQQAAAITLRESSVALSAGAGCGKTFVLTQRFLSELEPGPKQRELSQLVAITFTDRAAREMRDRIREGCASRLKNCPAEHVEHWLRMLRGLDAARISTIHSFCTGILRSHAVEAGLDPQFALVDPSGWGLFLDDVVKRFVFERVEQNDEDTTSLVRRYGIDAVRQQLTLLAGQRFRFKADHAAAATPADLAQAWRTRFFGDFLPQLYESLLQHPHVHSTRLLLQATPAAHPTMQERRRVILDTLDDLAQGPRRRELVATLKEACYVKGLKADTAFDDPDVYEVIKVSFGKIRDECDRLLALSNLSPEHFHPPAEAAVVGQRLLPALLERIVSEKAEAALLDFDDLLLLARNVLRDHPAVRRSVSHSIGLLLVDEFQDTDPVQAELVRMLCGERLTSGKLFMVGDHKQSIYRFRRADPRVFAGLRGELPEAGRLPLSVNFRSQPEILKFVNRVFQPIFGEAYEPLTPFQNEQLTPTPSIEFLWATQDATPSQGEASTKKPAAIDLRRREADWIARRIATLLEDPTPRVRIKRGGLRRVAAGDVVVLFRAMANVGEYEAAFRRWGIEYYLVGGRAFFAQQEVYDIVNLCRWLQDQGDLVALMGVLRSPLFNLSDDTLHACATAVGEIEHLLTAAPRITLAEGQLERWHAAQTTLRELLLLKGRVPLAELLERAVDLTGYDICLLNEYLGPRKVANLQKLIDLARDLDAQGGASFGDLANVLRQSVDEETKAEVAPTAPETSDVVRLMTIHQSKGLEFPVVFVADMNRKTDVRCTLPWAHPELGVIMPLPSRPATGETEEDEGVHPALVMLREEERRADADETLRLLYVALTRAADMLILSAGLDGIDAQRHAWLKALATTFQLTTGLPAIDPLLGGGTAANAGRDSLPHVHVHHRPPQPLLDWQQSRQEVPISQLAELAQGATPVIWPRPAPVPAFLAAAPAEPAPLQKSLSALEDLAQREGWLPRGHGDGHALDEGVGANRVDLGVLLHAVLERAPLHKPFDSATLVETYAMRLGHGLSEELQQETQAMVETWLASEIFSQLSRAQQVHREMEFLLPWPVNGTPRLLITGTIDCLFQTAEGEWHIRDYKTGLAGVQVAAPDLLAPYELQLYVYGLAIQQWFGQWPRHCGLTWLRPAFREVLPAWSTQQRARMDALLARAVESECLAAVRPAPWP